MAAVSDDWPQLLGPHRNGVYTGETVGWPSKFAWQKEVGSGFASPVIVGGKVILFHRKGNREIVEAFEAVRSDYGRHSRAARAIAQEYFRAETVLEKVIRDLEL